MAQRAGLPAIGADVTDLIRPVGLPAIGADVTELFAPKPRVATAPPVRATRGMIPQSTTAGDPAPFNGPRLVTAKPLPTPKDTRAEAALRKATGISAAPAKGPMGLADFMKGLVTTEGGPTRLSKKGEALIPFIGPITQAVDAYDVIRAARRVRDGNGTAADARLLEDFQGRDAEAQKRGTTLLYDAANVVAQLPGFAVEFAATGGAFKGTKALIDTALTKIATTKAARAAATAASYTAGAVAQTAAMPQRVIAEATRRQAPSPQDISDELKDWDDDFVPALARAVPDQFVEVFSERTGGLLEGPMKALAKIPLPKRVTALKSAVAAQWLKWNPSRTVADFLDKVRSETGWNGVLGEMFEERVGEVMRAAQPYLDEGGAAPPMIRTVTGEQANPRQPVENPRVQALKDFGYQLATEALGFAVPGATAALVARLPSTGRRQTPPTPPGATPPPAGPAATTPPVVPPAAAEGFVADLAAVRPAAPPVGADVTGLVERSAAPSLRDAYLSKKDYSAALRATYVDAGGIKASSRTTPQTVPIPPVGTWRIDDRLGQDGNEIEQLIEIPVDQITISEDTGRAKAADVEQYARWTLEGREAPPINITQTDKGTLKTMDHRRLLAAKAAGQTTIKAWVSWATQSDRSGNPVTGLTYELAQKGAQPLPFTPARAEDTIFSDDRKILDEIRGRLAKPTATFLGWQEDTDGRPAIPLYNVVGGELDGSTVGPDTLKARGIAVPETPAREVSLPKKEREEHTFSSTQVNLPSEQAQAVVQWAKAIPDEDLAENGRAGDSEATAPHVTLKYGLHTTDVDAVRKVLADEPPITLRLGTTSFFPNGESGSGDVLKIDVDSADLQRLNAKVSEALETTDTHPDYTPHVTIAYLKPGKGKAYEGDERLKGQTMTLDRVRFSTADGKIFEIPLTGKATLPSTGTTVEPWQQTRKEFKTAENQPRIAAIQAAIQAGTPIVLTTNARATRLGRPAHVRLAFDGGVEIASGKKWVVLTDPQIEALAAQAGVKPIPFAEKVFHHAAVEEAFNAGKDVPETVLVDYPTLLNEKRRAQGKAASEARAAAATPPAVESKAPWEMREDQIAATVKASKATGATHLDTMLMGVEALRGHRFTSLRDGKDWIARTVDNSGTVYFVSADGEMISEEISGREREEFVHKGYSEKDSARAAKANKAQRDQESGKPTKKPVTRPSRTKLDTTTPEAQTSEREALDSGEGAGDGETGRDTRSGVSASRPGIAENDVARLVRRRKGETVEQLTRRRQAHVRDAHAARKVAHFKALFADVLANAQDIDPSVDPAHLQREFNDHVDLWEELADAYRDGGNDPVDLLRAIAGYGGLSPESSGGMTGERRLLMENTVAGRWNNIQVFTAKGKGLAFDQMVEALQQDARFQWITDERILMNAIRDAFQHETKFAEGVYPGSDDLTELGMAPDQKWWNEPAVEEEPVPSEIEQAEEDSLQRQAEAVGVDAEAEDGDTSFDVKEFERNVPAEDDDIVRERGARYGEPQPRLSVLHNLSAENIIFADKMGGIAVPSMGVVTGDMGISGMGEITLIGKRDLADPRGQPVYDADVYSPTFPRAEYNPVRSADAQKVLDRIKPFAERFDDYNARQVTWDDAVNTPDPQKIIQTWLNGPAAKALYLSEQGVQVEPVLVPARLAVPWVKYLDYEAFRKVKPFNDERTIDEREQALRDVVPIVRAALDKYLASKDGAGAMLAAELRKGDQTDNARRIAATTWGIDGEWVNAPDGQLPRVLDWKIADSHNKLGTKEVDRGKTRTRLDRALKGKEAAFTEWVNSTVMGMFGYPFLRVRGRKEPYTINNIVEAMSGPVRAREKTMTYGEGKARAAAAKKFDDLEQMRRAAGALGDESTIKESREEAKKLIEAYRSSVIPYWGVEEYGGGREFGRTWEALDTSMKALARWAKGGKTETNMKWALAREGFRVKEMPAYIFEDAVEAGKAWLKAPVPYFEAKPQRAVKLSEFAGAVIPRKAPLEVRTILKKHGVPFVEYASGKTDQRENQQKATVAFRKKLAAQGADVLFEPKAEYGTPKVDLLDTGEEQPRLPGAEDVREQNIKTPEFDTPFSLTSEASKAKKGQQDTLFQPPAPYFYSRLNKAVEDSKQGKALGVQWKATIKNAKIGINAGEFDLARVEDLDDRTVYTKQEVLDYLAANQVKVEDVTLGRPMKQAARTDAAYTIRRARGPRENWIIEDSEGNTVGGSNTEAMAIENAEEWAARVRAGEEFHVVDEGTGRTHFDTYQLPGGDEGSYREVFLTVPTTGERTRGRTIAELETKRLPEGYTLINHGRRYSVQDPNGYNVGPPVATPGEAIEYARTALRTPGNAAHDRLSDETVWNDGHEAYKRILNPIVRLRFNTRQAGDQRVLFLEEVQPPSAENQKKMPPLFVKHWREIAFKWALRHAAENGLDAVAWTTGEQQAARYSLERQVESIYARADGENSSGEDVYQITVEGHNGETLHDTARTGPITVPEIEALIGKDLAKQIEGQESESHTYSGLDLKVGGEGLKKLYDVDFRNVVNGLPAVKKFGGKVGTVTLKLDNAPDKVVEQWAEREPEHPFVKKNRSVQPALTITPQLRDAVIMDGQPLFQQGANYERRPGTDAAASRIRANAAIAAVGTAARTAVSARAADRGAPLRSGTGLRALGITPELVNTQRIDLRGAIISNPHDLASLMQAARDPRIETLRYVYAKANKDGTHTVLASEAVSSRLPDASVTFLESKAQRAFYREASVTHGKNMTAWPEAVIDQYRTLQRETVIRFRDEQRRRMKRLGADRMWMVHNHPSGDPTPSHDQPGGDDVSVTVAITRAFPEFSGHVVIDSGSYAVIEADGTYKKWPITTDERLHAASVPHEVIGMLANTPRLIRDVAMRLNQAGGVTVVYLMPPPEGSQHTRRLTVRAIETVEASRLNNPEFAGFLRNRKSEVGAQRAILYVENEHYPRAVAFYRNETVDDVITAQASASESRLTQVPQWQRNRGFRVREEKAQYGTTAKEKKALTVTLKDLARVAAKRKVPVEALRRQAEKAGYTVVDEGPRPIRVESDREIPPAKPIPGAKVYEFPSIQKMPVEIRGDIEDLLNQYHGFETQRRGVQSWARTTELSKDVWLPLETLRLGKALNAEELHAYQTAIATALTMRKPLLEKMKDGTATDWDKVQVSHLTDVATVLTASYRGAKAETGRALNILRVKARVLDLRESAFLERAMQAPGFDGDLMKLSKEALDAAGDPLKQLELLRRRTGTGFDLFLAYYYGNLLSGIKTQERNIIGNSFNMVANLVTPVGAVPIDVLRSARTGQPRTVFLGEIPQAVVGSLVGIESGIRNGYFTFVQGFRPRTVASAKVGQFDTPRVEMPGGLWNPWNVPGRALEAADEFFRAIAHHQELYAITYATARQEGLTDTRRIRDRMADLMAATDPTTTDGQIATDIMERVSAFEDRAVFQEPAGHVVRALMKLKGATSPLPVRAAVTFIMPFMRISGSITRQGFEYSPAGFAMRGATGKMGTGRVQSQAQGRALIGSLALLPMAWLAATGRLTGAPPDDPGEREEFYAQGKLANAVKIGKYWVRYVLFQPFSVPMSAVANAWKTFQASKQDEGAAQEAFAAAVAGAGASILDQSFLSGLGTILDAVNDPQRYAGRWLSLFAQGFVPLSGLMRNITQATDATVRRPEGVPESVKAIVPGQSSTLTPRRTRTGEPATHPGGWLRRGFLVPEVSKEIDDDLTATLARVGHQPIAPRAQLTLRGERVPLTRAQDDVLIEALGRERKWMLETAIRRQGFTSRADDVQLEILERASAIAGRSVRARALRAVRQKTPFTLDRLVSSAVMAQLAKDRSAVLGVEEEAADASVAR